MKYLELIYKGNHRIFINVEHISYIMEKSSDKAKSVISFVGDPDDYCEFDIPYTELVNMIIAASERGNP